jgi:hypothetical protein
MFSRTARPETPSQLIRDLVSYLVTMRNNLM